MNNFDVSKLEWTREPADFSISAGRITITTNPHTDYGREPIIVFETTVRRFCRWRRKRRTSLLQ